ncbi:MAG: hypothetical protein AB1Z23_04370 [Eubacteriales bacterium]
MADKIAILKHYSVELTKIKKELKLYSETSDYLYTNAIMSYVKRYNEILKKYHKSTGIPLELFNILEHEYSSTKKTIRESLTSRFNITIDSTKSAIEDMILNEDSKNESKIIPMHQMRKCLKLDMDNCPKNPKLDNNKIFVGMPFDNKYKDSYDYGIKIAIESLGMTTYRADEEISNRDIMCKICEQMQICKYLIFNISGHNPNVMLELGLSYGLGKETIIIKDKETKHISDLANIEYIEYEHANELSRKLVSYFTTK